MPFIPVIMVSQARCRRASAYLNICMLGNTRKSQLFFDVHRGGRSIEPANESIFAMLATSTATPVTCRRRGVCIDKVRADVVFEHHGRQTVHPNTKWESVACLRGRTA
jgi:hypothetical protein